MAQETPALDAEAVAIAEPQRVSDVVEAAPVSAADVTPAPEVRTLDPLVSEEFENSVETVVAEIEASFDSAGMGSSVTSVTINTGEILVAEIDVESSDEGVIVAELVTEVVFEAPMAEENEGSPAGPSRRDMLKGEPFAHPEPVSMLTPERILEKSKKREIPSAGWNRFVYRVSLHAINLGDSPAVRHRKALDASMSRRLDGATRFIPVLTRKGGVGKTTVTTLIGMALASTREDRIIAIDANPDRGTLAERFTRYSDKTVRDLVAKANTVTSFSDFTAFVTRDKTRLDVLASDTDPFLSEAFNEDDYNVVADLVSRYYTIALTDCGTGIVHSVMSATLKRADSLVIVSGGSFDEARLAAETLTWLETNGYSDLVRNAIVAINTATQGTNLVKIDEIEAHFQSRVRAIVRIPYA
jgi:MinD-like ATPase involved in chromosome partitioning or flagellar assembly